jgi:NAD(P)-dependent dehydrogenase (short-subunit alcohol dehydrogenase family)
VVATGSTKGIGRRIAERSLEAGAKMATSGRSFDENVLNSFKGNRENLVGKAVDVRNVHELQSFLGGVVRDFGRIGVPVNNAGIYQPVPT